ncbi:MAG: aminopeptidase [Saprospiraceae bacterium]|nr:aminopeptidase [Saprospiraceae bacterium]MCF8252111.1 aminopeptidase [Saprospiraceae bacterium]MCF8282468.1 aminopeptidase [Bacteroidales bacterium]MCF8313754.1 aminopeptidase [Saprospiraceae bacterium]MCF8442439.1 aminopeptidase [Saprospiraceae bacterium]
MDSMLAKYARLLVQYCLSVKEGEKLYVSSTTLAEPLVREVWREALRAGAIVEVDLSFREKNRIMYAEASDAQLKHVSPVYRQAMEEFDCYLNIMAPFNLREDQHVDAGKVGVRREATKDLNKTYFERTATRSLKRNLCQYPTLANAQQAGMSLEEYEQFVFNACRLYEDDPTAAWLEVRRSQQHIVDFLNQKESVQYQGDGIDISFSTKGRTWINSDGQTNMPSGEVYTSPVEDSVNGTVHFNYPIVHAGHEVEGVTLWVKDGRVEKWEAKRGKELLDDVFQNVAGSRHFGEAAIGTNYKIDRFTKNILFDEKIGGSVHMAIGQSYLQTGGKNQSSIHWDMIADMKNGGQIFADGEKIYEGGKFLL